MKLINKKPRFKSGDTVYVILMNEIEKTYIRSAICELLYCTEKKEEYIIFTGWYDVGIFTFTKTLSPSLIQDKFIYKTNKEALKMIKWYPAKLTEEQWLLAVGDRDISDGPGNIEDGCDLPIGDSNDGTSEIRSLLLLVKKNKGCTELSRIQLQNQINSCPNRPESLNNPKSNLSKLLKQLKLKWKGSENVL